MYNVYNTLAKRHTIRDQWQKRVSTLLAIVYVLYICRCVLTFLSVIFSSSVVCFLIFPSFMSFSLLKYIFRRWVLFVFVLVFFLILFFLLYNTSYLWLVFIYISVYLFLWASSPSQYWRIQESIVHWSWYSPWKVTSSRTWHITNLILRHPLDYLPTHHLLPISNPCLLSDLITILYKKER